MAVKFVISYAHVRSHQSIAQSNVTDTAFEAFHVIKQSKALDYHCRTSA